MTTDQISTLRYWWAQQENEKNFHWLSWEVLTTESKEETRWTWLPRLTPFNVAMLARQGWRLLMAPESLCAQVLQAKYFPDGNIITANEQTSISYSWRRILRGMRNKSTQGRSDMEGWEQ